MNAHDKKKAAFGGLAVSIVSHGHGAQVSDLLHQLARLCGTSITRVVLTINTPEPGLPPPAPEGGWPFAVEVVHNARPQGFGANHNCALAQAPEGFVCILNPDVVLLTEAGDVMASLRQAAASASAGIAYPVQVDSAGIEQESRRELTTPLSLLRRRLLGHKQQRTDWVNAACIVLPTHVWHEIGGFDERFFMYCEDVDLCIRVQLAGWSMVAVPVHIVHAGERASSRRWTHFRWHVQSLCELWRSPAYAKALRRLRLSGSLTSDNHP